jgi:hypothetical protein
MMNTKVKTGIGMLGAFALMGTGSTYAEIQLAKGLTADGFIDMSATYTDPDSGETDESMSFDQFEIDFYFDFENGVKARVDIDHEPSDDTDATEVEQAILSYATEGGLTLQAGRFLTPLGYEAAEPTGLWQYSASATIIGYPGYANGVAARQGFGDVASVYVAVVDGSYTGDSDANDLSFEAQLKLMPFEGFTFQAGYASEEMAGTDAIGVLGDVDFVAATESYDQGFANFWAEYTLSIGDGTLTVAGEYNQLFEIGASDADGDGYLVMANYSVNKVGLTVRHSAVELDTGYEDTAFTVSPNYTFNDNLFGLVEFRTDDFGDDGDATSLAAELIFTF